MSGIELFYSFVIGIASGVVSSVMVTAFYRSRDKERDRQSYFLDIRLYVNKLMLTDINDIKSMRDFLSSTEIPPRFKWIHLKKDEFQVIAQLTVKVCELTDKVTQYFMDELDLIEKGMEQDKIDLSLSNQLQLIIRARIEILAMRQEINMLGNKTLKRIKRELERQS